jgi:hypothetical protein
MFSSTAGWLLLVVTDEGTAATRTRADSGQTLGTGVGTRAGLPVDVRNHKRGAFARAGWLRRPTPPLVVKPGGAASLQLIFRRRAGSPWSWHQFGRVGPDGCPGFKGPFPQPVSMSGTKFRCDSTLAQGTSAQSRRSRCEGKEHYPQAPSGAPGPEAPRKTRKPVPGAPARRPCRARFSERFWTGVAAGTDSFAPLGLARTASRLRSALQCINVLAH